MTKSYFLFFNNPLVRYRYNNRHPNKNTWFLVHKSKNNIPGKEDADNLNKLEFSRKPSHRQPLDELTMFLKGLKASAESE